MDLGDPFIFDHFFGGAGKYQIRLAQLVMLHLDILPAQSGAPASAERFEKRLLGRESGSVILRLILYLAIAIFDFCRRENLVHQKTRPIGNMRLEPGNLNDVNANSVNQLNTLEAK